MISTIVGKSALRQTTLLASLRSAAQSKAAPFNTRVTVVRSDAAFIRSFTTTRVVFVTAAAKSKRPGPKPRAPSRKNLTRTAKAKAQKTATAKAKSAKKKAASAKKPKKKTVKSKSLTPEQKAKRKETLKKKEIIARKKELKEKSLISEEPKASITNAYLAFTQEKGPALRSKGLSVTDVSKQLGEAYSKLSSVEVEKYKAIAEQSRATYVAARDAWIKSKTPAEILAANQARHQLKRMGVPSRATIKDDRLPTRPRTAFNYLFAEALEGNTSGKHITEVLKEATAKWKSLSPAQKKPYEDLAEKDKQRYEAEVNIAFK